MANNDKFGHQNASAEVITNTKTSAASTKDQVGYKKEFMGFPLAGGPDDDVSRLLSRDLF